MADVSVSGAKSGDAAVRAEVARTRSDAARASLYERLARLQRSRAVAYSRRLAMPRPVPAPRGDRRAWAGDFRWRVERSPEVVVARLSGQLDIAAEPALEAVRREVLAATPARVVVDLRALEFIGSTGLHWLVALKRAVPQASRLELIRGRDSVHAVFAMPGVGTRFEFVGDEQAASDERMRASPRIPQRGSF